MSQEQINQITVLIKDAYYSSKEAHEILFEEYDNKENQITAAVLINRSISLISAAKAIYYSNYESLAKTDIENIFSKFDLFESEFMTNFPTGHSHQHTGLKFKQFEESVKLFFEV
ncbi:MAG: hypothetical protein AWU54_295 [Candidatus Frackibacter sp. T328-2]|nr:MAG: hypothetical protein AWU54_295 [Candidatus Frackibacter sp. T328-2]